MNAKCITVSRNRLYYTCEVFIWDSILAHQVTYEHGIMLKGNHQNSQQREKLLYHLGIYYLRE